ncbi:hypothetical protein A3746_14615 [Oleibacter sp. HI0075]|nr:hypothetical protein A3746_14615 [Oleibacter sp. HI0075]
MPAYEFQDTAGNRYRLSKGAGPSFFHPENICSGSTLRAELLLDGVDSQAVDHGFNHFYFDVLAQLPAKTSNPRKALADALAGNYLTLEQINTASAIDDYVPDERPFLKAQIQTALEKIIAEERREAAMHERQLSKESFGNVALIYLGGFAYNAYRSGKELVLWLKEVSDLVNPVVRMEHRFKAAQAAWLQDNLADAANVYAQTYVEGEKRELVEALGFDPTTITLEQLDEAMAMASLIWDDPNLKMQLTKFIKDYASAQHSIEMTEALGAEALGILLSVILVALTAGAALPAVGFNAVRKFKVLGELLVEYARVTQRIARQLKRFSGKGKKSATHSDFDSDEIIVRKTPPPPPYKPHPGAVERGPKAGDTIHKRLHEDGETIDSYTLQADGKPMGADAGKMPDELSGLEDLPENHDALVEEGWPDLNKEYRPGKFTADYANFTDASPVVIKEGETIYRIVDELNFDGGGYWARELPPNKTQWRKGYAVKDSWNDNGYYIEHTVQKGESIKAWEGGAAGQRYEKHEGKDFYLSGGDSQLFVTPGEIDTAPARLTNWPEK